MFESVKPVVEWFAAMEKRIQELEAETHTLRGEVLMLTVDQVMADCRAERDGKVMRHRDTPLNGASKIGLSNIPRVPKHRLKAGPRAPR
jgi:hypothetical protein